MSFRLNLGELRHRGTPLFTREAAAVLREVCCRLAEADEEGRALAAPSPEQLWVTADGHLVIDAEPRGAGDGTQSTMHALAVLIEALLPPTTRDKPDFAVPGSFRVLAPRARGFPPGLSAIRTPAELEAAVARYRNGDTPAVLQHLFARTAAPAPAPAPAEAAPVSEREAEISPPIVSIASSSNDEATVASPMPGDRDDVDLPLQRQSESPWVRPVVPSNVGTWRRRPWPWLLMGAAATVLAFVLSYEVTRRMAERPEVVARAQARSAPERSVGPASPTHSTASPRSPEGSPVPAQAKPGPSPKQAVPLDSRDQAAAETATSFNRAPVVQSPDAVREMPISAPVPLQTPASTGPVFSPSFAASGSALVFHAGREPVARVMSADIGENSPLELVTIVNDRARNYHPRLSPDGRLLAFDSDRDGERGVYVANRDGSDVRRVSGPGFASVPSWSPDMRALTFVRGEPDRPEVWNLWRLDRASGALTRLTRHSYGQTWGASWFPDSRRLCYSHEDRLILLDVDDGTSRVFRSPHAGRLVRTPAVSPDGRLVAFQVLRDGVWLLDLASGVMRRLIEDPSAEEFAWDPNGGRLAYHSRRSGEWRIWIAGAPPAIANAH